MTVSSATNRVSYNGNGSTTVFAYTFKVFDQDDLTVIIRSANGAETVKTITTHYTVSGVGNAGGGNVTMLTAPASGETLVIIREQDLIQELDIVPNDPFPAESVETALDKLTFIVQQHDEELSRAIKASRTNTISSTEFTISAANRANKVFSFDGAGELAVTQELGIFRGNWAASTSYAVRDLVKDTSTNNIFIAVTAHTSTGSQPITTNTDSAKWALIVDAASATTSASAAASSASAAATSESNAASSASAASTSASNAASSASSASTSATNSSNSATASAASAASAAASYDSFDDRYLGAKASNPTLDNDGSALIDGALYFDTTNNVMKVYDLGTTTWLRTTPSSGDQANINTVTGIAADITTVAGISGDVATVAGISADVTAVVADEVDIGIVAADLTGSNTVSTVAGIAANVTTVAGISADVTTAATNIAAIIAAPAEAAAAAASEANALVYRNDAQSARDQSQAARDTANLHKLAAEAAATSATNTAAALTGFDLDAIAASKAVTAVDVFVYDTSRDSDGGAWRKRTQHTSWYNETLNTATRGSRREFPAVAVIVAEASKVTIYDGDDPALPMWMVFNAGSTAYIGNNIAGRNCTSTTALNAQVSVGRTSDGLFNINFIKDNCVRNSVSAASIVYINPVSQRNASGTFFVTSDNIVDSTVNDVAMTVLPDAPIDPATGLPVPTIAVATDGGVSVITDSGAVYDTTVGFTPVGSVSFDADGNLFNRRNAGNDWCAFSTVADYTSGDGFGDLFAAMTVGNQAVDMLGGAGKNAGDFGGTFVEAGSLGLGLHKLNTTAFSQSLSAKVTSTYNTGWMNGDIKGAFLSDTDDTDLVASGIDDDFTGYADQAAATAAGYSFANSVTFDAATDAAVWSGTGEGQFQFDVASGFANGTNLIVEVVVSGATKGSLVFQNNFVNVPRLDGGGNIGTVAGTYSFSMTKNGGLRFASAGTFDGQIDNISVKLADVDRSVNNRGLIVNGTVVRSPVATGAELVAYSGFSASNYLEQPYNSALDFGTGDFCVMGWFNLPAGGSQYQIVDRKDAVGATGGAWQLKVENTSQKLYFSITDDYYTTRDEVLSSMPVDTGAWTFGCAVRSGSTIYIYVNGGLAGSTAITNATGSLSKADAKLLVGIVAGGSIPFAGSLALLRISATAPTAEQIRKIYEDEKVLFQENAACTLYGASNAVTALAHDPDTGLLHVGTSAGRSVFQGLRRVANTTTAVGTAISASNGLVVDE